MRSTIVKGKNDGIRIELGSDVDMVAQKAYTFPLPISETDAVQRDNNR